METCAICAAPMVRKTSEYTFYCSACDYWSSNLPVEIESSTDALFDDTTEGGEVLSFLDAIRAKNFKAILDNVALLMNGQRLRILDVGCATGFFIKTAASRGHEVTGLEPNPQMAKAARANGHEVINGYFPDALDASAQFDLIIFNDVFEHIPNLENIVDGISKHLAVGGMLVINLPNSGGALFRIGRMLNTLGVSSLWDRLWQKMFYTPHVHYFNAASLDKFLGRHALSKVTSHQYLPIVALDGLWGRVNADKKSPVFKRLLMYLTGALSIPLLGVFEKDIVVGFYRK